MSLNVPKFLDHVHGSFKIVLERNREVCFLFDCQHVITKAKVERTENCYKGNFFVYMCSSCL